MTEDEELTACIQALGLLVIQAQSLHAEKNYKKLSNVLNRTMKVALEGTYCITDIADIV